MSINNKYSLEEIINCVEIWLVKGDINDDILADNFKFISPFWKGNNKTPKVLLFLLKN